MNIFMVALGGAIGAVLRYILSTFINRNFDFKFFIAGTLIVNLIGCFLIGLFYALAKNYESLNEIRLLIVVGFLGAFTTFSSITYESITLLKSLGFVAFSANIILNVVFGLIATYIALIFFK
ncbi:fluoride efflux transporter CrcB [Campylobacter sp. RM9333]|uniref:fluoride efflux transporter CrcB n=1 Tax=Campylobacter sp. RM9333 TaxID=2735731 RepID=UPI001D1D24F1|nr:fluoride efflux transporter CrcB [Campylobacter sp. RM9333]